MKNEEIRLYRELKVITGQKKILIQLNEWGFGSQLAMTIFQKYRGTNINPLRRESLSLD